MSRGNYWGFNLKKNLPQIFHALNKPKARFINWIFMSKTVRLAQRTILLNNVYNFNLIKIGVPMRLYK